MSHVHVYKESARFGGRLVDKEEAQIPASDISSSVILNQGQFCSSLPRHQKTFDNV